MLSATALARALRLGRIAMVLLATSRGAYADPGMEPTVACTVTQEQDGAVNTITVTARSKGFSLERSLTLTLDRVTSRTRIGRGKKTLIEVESEADDSGSGTVSLIARYERAIRHTKHFVLRSDGEVIVGEVNRRPLAPIAVSEFSIDTPLRFGDGTKVSLGPYRHALGRAVVRLDRLEKSLQTCSVGGVEVPITSVPHPRFALDPHPATFVGDAAAWACENIFGGSECDCCKVGCGFEFGACSAAAGSATGPAVALAMAACLANEIKCFTDCGCKVTLSCKAHPGTHLCGYFCCHEDEVCNPALGKGGDCCAGSQIIAPNGECCYAFSICGSACCQNSICNESSYACCGYDTPPCGSGCCNVDKCSESGECCDSTSYPCGKTCCGSLSPCFPDLSLCGPLGSTKCGYGKFCDGATEACVNGNCCPVLRACGNTCCPANQRCDDPVSETCVPSCSGPVFVNPVLCQSGGTRCCPGNAPGLRNWECCDETAYGCCRSGCTLCYEATDCPNGYTCYQNCCQPIPK